MVQQAVVKLAPQARQVLQERHLEGAVFVVREGGRQGKSAARGRRVGSAQVCDGNWLRCGLL